MARFEFKLPDIGEGVAEGEIVSWLVEVGDVVTENQDLVEVMTDKATVTIGSPKSGRVKELGGPSGTTVPVGQVLLVLDVEGEEPAGEAATSVTQPAAETHRTAEVSASAVGDLKEELPGVQTQGALAPSASAGTGGRETAAHTDQPASGTFTGAERPLAAPATRKLARELGVGLSDVQPSGKAGRITREDVERHAQAQRRAEPSRDQAPAAEPASSVPVGWSETRPRFGEERVTIRGLRRRIYENMARSKRTAAHFTYVDECDVTELVALRERLSPLALAEQTRLTYLPFIVKAVTVALKRHPTLNSTVDDARQEMVLRQYCDIGIATATDAGLIVPVLRRAEQLSLLDIAREIQRLAEAARAGKTRPEDLGGSSFTITSLGKSGGLLATPVINYPEVAILFVAEIKRRPVVRGDSIAVGQVMTLSLSFDHRIIDGHVGAAFGQEIKACLEQPDRLFLAMGWRAPA
jgi:pyruvate dehydrogenase E2 component (dihydrolipoamide acetyltransferase)